MSDRTAVIEECIAAIENSVTESCRAGRDYTNGVNDAVAALRRLPESRPTPGSDEQGARWADLKHRIQILATVRRSIVDTTFDEHLINEILLALDEAVGLAAPASVGAGTPPQEPLCRRCGLPDVPNHEFGFRDHAFRAPDDCLTCDGRSFTSTGYSCTACNGSGKTAAPVPPRGVPTLAEFTPEQINAIEREVQRRMAETNEAARIWSKMALEKEADVVRLTSALQSVRKFAVDWCEDIDQRSGVDAMIHVRELVEPVVAPSSKDTPQEPEHVRNLRTYCHATFNGGHEDKEARRAFHHGIDTVCNVMAEWEPAAAPRPASVETLDEARRYVERCQQHNTHLIARHEVELAHARTQAHADGFQVGWHAALQRIGDGDVLAELRLIVPLPAAPSDALPETERPTP